ncbi:MAG: DUF3999 family protein [Capnocytophaga sp.]|nr:DUF3999 family protein [Capnocytophaga sp.]
MKNDSKTAPFSVRLLLLAVILLSTYKSIAQWQSYDYWQELAGVKHGGWYAITLTDSIYERLQSGTNDLRIIGITPQKDTLTAPYLLETKTADAITRQIDYQIINSSKSSEGYYYTIRPKKKQDLNHIELQLDNRNFDWKIHLEGSNDQKQWFTLLSDYRIVAVHNADVDFRYTSLSIPTSEYAYYRLFFPTEEVVKLRKANVLMTQSVPQQLTEYTPQQVRYEDTKQKRTVIELTLPNVLPVSEIQIRVPDTPYYFRQYYIETAKDSSHINQNTRYHYYVKNQGVIHSEKENTFALDNSLAKKIRLIIQNDDNQPLSQLQISVRGKPYKIITRIDAADADYYLIYGKKQENSPRYDIQKFSDKIPEQPTSLTLKKTIRMQAHQDTVSRTTNPFVMWIATAIIVVIIIFFSIKMLRENPQNQ